MSHPHREISLNFLGYRLITVPFVLITGQLLYTLQRGVFCLIFSEIEVLSRSRRSAQYNTPRIAALRASFLEVLRIRKEVKAILEIESEGQAEREHAAEMDEEGLDFASVRRILDVPVGSES